MTVDDAATNSKGLAEVRQESNPLSPSPVDRLAVVWRAKFIIALVGIIVGGIVYFVSQQITPVYKATATLRVSTASTPGGSAEDSAQASNDIAAQDAEIVTTGPILEPAATKAGVSASFLSSHVSAGTVASQNLIQISTQASTPEAALRYADGVVLSLQGYLVQHASTAAAALQNSVTNQIAPLTAQITALQSAITANAGALPGSPGLAILESDESQLSELVSARGTLMANTALAIASEQPSIQVLQSASAPSKTSPKPKFYGLIALLGGLLVAVQVSISVAQRHPPSARREKRFLKRRTTSATVSS